MHMPGRSGPCPICLNHAQITQGNGDYVQVTCPRCGSFELSGDLVPLLELRPLGEQQAPLASSWIRERQGLRLYAHHDPTLRAVQAPSVDEQATRLLQELARRHPIPGASFAASFADLELEAIAWAHNRLHLEYLIAEYLCRSKEYMATRDEHASNYAYRVRVTPKGWAFLESVRRVNPDSHLGFIAMWFHESTRALRDNGLKVAVRRAGYQPTLVDERHHSNRIDAEIVATIRKSKFVVADIRSRRGGVYFEAGFAQGLGLPVFWTCQQRVLERQRLHFDVRQFPFTPWAEDDWDKFTRDLSSLIVAIVGQGPLGPE